MNRTARYWRRFRALLRVWRARMRSHPVLHLTWRITIGVLGTIVLLGGVVMCVTPGPGIGGIILGLAILSTEFSWANRLLWRARRYAHTMKEKANKAIREHRKRHPAP